MQNEKKTTNWYVITGGPGSGKTTMVNLLKARGYKTTIENARHYFDMQRLNGHTVEEVRKHQEEFQLRVLEMQIEVEKELQPDEVVFLDRAIPDALAYYKYLNIIIDPQLAEAMFKVNYKKIFILDCLPLVQDYARTEDEEAQKKIHAVIVSVYESLPFPIIRVPVMLPHERVDFILKNL
ncbi:MAG: ATP-binding protein [Chitinophagales bacterium]|nr:ATP-binding protein [Chitinophagales bacterium]